MRLVITIDPQGVEKVEITHSGDSERAQAHRLYKLLQVEIEKIDTAVKAAAAAGEHAE